MDSAAGAPRTVDPEAIAFVRFCRDRRRVAWPELYDEMWAVASRGLFRGYGFAELDQLGIEFGLTGMRRLAGLVSEVLASEPQLASRRAVSPARCGLAVIGRTETGAGLA